MSGPLYHGQRSITSSAVGAARFGGDGFTTTTTASTYGGTRYTHKPPIVPPRWTKHSLRPPSSPPSSSSMSSTDGRLTGRSRPPPQQPQQQRRRPKIAYVLMHDKKGWQSLASQGAGIDTEYLRLSPTAVDVDVEKGTLVDIDPSSDFDPRTNISLIVVSLDRPEVKIPLLMKELLVIEEEVYDRLLPLRPSERYEFVTSKNQHIMSAMIGDTVWYLNSDGHSDVGMIQYIGTVPGMGSGVWYGIELLDANRGCSDGKYGNNRYFSAPPRSSVFANLSELRPYEETMNKEMMNKNVYNRLQLPPPQILGLPASDSLGRMKIISGTDSCQERSEGQDSWKRQVQEYNPEKYERRKSHSVPPSPPSQPRSPLQSPVSKKSLQPAFENLESRRDTPKIFQPAFENLESRRDTRQQQEDIEIGTLVELRMKGEPVHGVVRWIGWLPDHDSKAFGVELEEEIVGGTNGWHGGSQLFSCPDGRAVFVPCTHVRLDERFGNGEEEQGQERGGGGFFGDLPCPLVSGYYSPLEAADVRTVCGRSKGIQGHRNSCYLDATLFAMFSFTSVFDSLLHRQPNRGDIPEYVDVQRVLREEIVNPLRKNHFVRADRVMKLRKFLDHLTSVKGLLTEEKDPEEFLLSLLTQSLNVGPFLELSTGETAHLYQIFVERDPSVIMPTVQQLFEQSFLTSGVKLSKVPSVLILQLPRFGKQFKVYDRILPSPYLDVTDVIQDAPRQCIICGKLATLECLDCFRDHGGSGLDSTAFCEGCLSPVHNHHKRRNHQARHLKIPMEFLNNRANDSVPRQYMELFAVVCIETSHYVSFVKCGSGPDSPWCFFDSMADRKGEQNGYNIPEVTAATEVHRWFTDDGIAFLKSCQDDKLLPMHAKRFICDGYMCFYQSPEVRMYQ